MEFHQKRALVVACLVEVARLIQLLSWSRAMLFSFNIGIAATSAICYQVCALILSPSTQSLASLALRFLLLAPAVMSTAVLLAGGSTVIGIGLDRVEGLLFLGVPGPVVMKV